MQIESLNCNGCGAPLNVPQGANYVHCNHCGANLAVHRDENTTYTEKLETIDERTKEMQQQLGTIAGQLSDSEKPPELTPTGKVIGSVMGFVFGCMFAAGGATFVVIPFATGPDPDVPLFVRVFFPILGLGVAVFGICICIASLTGNFSPLKGNNKSGLRRRNAFMDD